MCMFDQDVCLLQPTASSPVKQLLKAAVHVMLQPLVCELRLTCIEANKTCGHGVCTWQFDLYSPFYPLTFHTCLLVGCA